MKKRTLILSLAAACFSSLLGAGDFKKTVDELGDRNTAGSALSRLTEAGGDAFEDLLDGARLDPASEKDAAKQAQKSAIRLACVRLLGTLRDTRATNDLLKLVRDDATRAAYPELVAACCTALAKIAGAKPDAAGSADAVAEIKKLAQDEKGGLNLRYACLMALAEVKQGGEIARPFLKEGTDETLRHAAVLVIGASKHTAAADELFAIWEAQRKGEARSYTLSLGVSALFALANFGDERAIQGLVDLSTLLEFDRENAYRDLARGFLKELAAKAIPILVEIIKDDARAAQHNAAARLLGELGAEGVRALVDVAKLDKAGETKYGLRVESLLFQLTNDDAIVALMDAYRAMTPEDPSRARLLKKILAQRPRSALDFFKTIVSDKAIAATERAMAVETYADLKGKDSFEDLKAWASDDMPEVRRAATRNLGREFVPLSKSEEVLKLKLDDPDAETRTLALRGLQRSDKKENLPLFTKRLKEDTEPSVRRTAIEALEQFNNNAKLDGEGVYDVVKAAFNEDKDSTVRAQALRLGITLAEIRGDSATTKDMVNKALVDGELVVRTQLYSMLFRASIKNQIDMQKLIDAALKETEPQGRGDAVQALSYIEAEKWAGKLERLDAVADLGLAVLGERNSHFAVALLPRLSEKGGQFNRIAEKARAMLDEALKAANPSFTKISVILDVLAGVRDNNGATFENARKAAKLQSVEARRSAVKFIAALGDKNDISFLREVSNLGDATAPALKREIEDAIRALELK